jgi:hypothetical protein
MIFEKAYICESCFHIQKRFRRSVCERCKSSMFICDEWIAPTISTLNKKGYLTSYCCSGHPVSAGDKQKCFKSVDKKGKVKKFFIIETFGTYVAFKNKEEFSDLPTNFYFEELHDGCTIIRWQTFVGDTLSLPSLKDYSNHSERLLAVSTALIDLDYWAEKLPSKISVNC